MIILITTKSEKADNGFALHQTEYLDFIEASKKKLAYNTFDKNVADCINIGFALRQIIESDRKFGLQFNNKIAVVGSDKDYKAIRQTERYITYKGTDIKRYAFVLTDNEEIYNSISYSMRPFNSLITRMINKIIQLKKPHLIKVLHGNEHTLTSEFIERLKQDYA